ncbi:MAG: glutamine synthetase family protein [Chloroflexota bacterium]|nr:glutamine synthetase family protein [Chloroflexota bacterium]
MTGTVRGIISIADLKRLVSNGEIDTVISAICDMQGRLVGKRVTASFFIDHLLEHGTHFCTYLLGTDMEMETPDGFPTMNWESGYGDYLAIADWSTLRVIPWLEKTALVLADPTDEATMAPVPIAPRSLLKRQIERAASLGLRPMMASELEFYLFRESFQSAQAKGYAGLERFGWYNEDYHLLQATKAEPLYRKFRNLMTEAGIPVEFSKGEAAPGQHEVNIRYTDALESADRAALFKHGAKEIAFQDGYAVTFMAKPDQRWTGSSGHVHLSLWDEQGSTNRFFDPEADAHGMSETMRYFLGGLVAGSRELSLLIASTINAYKRYAAASWAPVNLLWARDNRTCGFRIVGHDQALRIENRLPGADANPYLSYAAILAAGLHGIEQKIEPPPEFHGNGYRATGVPRVPSALYQAIETFAGSALARDAFGAEVVAHYLNMARVEQQSYDMTVTDWERHRYFERG